MTLSDDSSDSVPLGIHALRWGVLVGLSVFFLLLVGNRFIGTGGVQVHLELSTTTGDVGEVFYAAPDEPTSGDRSVPFRIKSGIQRLVLALPDRPLSLIRLDPGSEPGAVSLRRVALTYGGRELKLVDGPRIARVAGLQNLRREPRADDAVNFRATASDPFVVFAIPATFSGAQPFWHRALGWAALAGILTALSIRLLTARAQRVPTLSALVGRCRAWLRSLALAERPLWWSLLVPVGAGLLWADGQTLPLVMCLALGVALTTTVFAGLVAHRWLAVLTRGNSQAAHGPGLFQLLWVGQYAVFALALLISPVAALLTWLTGIRFSYGFSLPLAVFGLTLFTRRAARAGGPALGRPRLASIPLAALTGLALFRAMSMHAVHAGALGHDTQQHLYWAHHIFDFGYVPVTVRGSVLIDYYPKFFHLLAVSWSALGLSRIVGPFMRLMPALQVTLACGFLCELVLQWVGDHSPQRRGGRLLFSIALGAFLAWHLTLGDGQQIYDGNDLSGTPRLAAAWILLGLPLLFLAYHIGTLGDVRALLVASIPVFSAVALGVNPVLLPIFFTYSLPFTLLFALFTRDRSVSFAPPRWRRALLFGVVVSGFISLLNPFVIDKLAHTGPGSSLFVRLGGRIAPLGIPDPGSAFVPPALCETSVAECAADLASDSLSDGAARFASSVMNAEMPAFGSGGHSFAYWFVFGVPLLGLALQRLLVRDEPIAPSPRSARTFLAILVASALPAVIHPILFELLGKLVGQGSTFVMLHGYYGSLQMFLGAWIRCLLPLSSWLLLPLPRLRTSVLAVVWWCATAIVLLNLSDFHIASLASHRNARWPWGIDWAELRTIERLNGYVPADETVVVPAEHVVMFGGREHILMAGDPTGMAATLLTTRLLFLVRLGSGADYNWTDLEQRFCANAESRATLLRTVNARWVLIRDFDPASARQLDVDLWHCGVTLRTLGAEYPPAWRQRDLALYRINP